MQALEDKVRELEWRKEVAVTVAGLVAKVQAAPAQWRAAAAVDLAPLREILLPVEGEAPPTQVPAGLGVAPEAYHSPPVALPPSPPQGSLWAATPLEPALG